MNWILIFIVAAFWGGSFIAIKQVVQFIDPVLGAALRIMIAALSVRIFQLISRKNVIVDRKYLPKIWLAGFLGLALPFMLLFWGETHISPGLAGIINGTVPLWTFLLAVNFLNTEEKFTTNKAAGIAVGITGLIFIFYPEIHFKGAKIELLAMFAVLSMALSYATNNILTRVILRGGKISFHGNLFHQHAGALVIMVLVCAVLGKYPNGKVLSMAVILPVLYLGICSTALALFIYYHLIKTLGTVKASIIIYIVPIMALLWDRLFFANLPKINQVGGMCLVLFGVFLIEKKFYPASHKLKGGK